MSQLKIGLLHAVPEKLQHALIAIAVRDEDVKKGKLENDLLTALDALLGGALAVAVKDAEFEGKAGTELSLHTHGKIAAARVLLLGIGKGKDRDCARLTAARAVRAAERAKATSASYFFPFGEDPAFVGAATEGALLGAYKFDRYLSDRKEPRLAKFDIVLDAAPTKAQKAAFDLAEEVGAAVNLARDLVNEPPNVVNPTTLANAAKDAAKHGGLRIEVLEKKDLQKLGMRMFLGVSQGSAEPPKLIHMWWDPDAKKPVKKGKTAKAVKPLAFVGKAITFDSGGLSLKTAQGMETMKCDMGGSAAVIGAMRVVGHLKPAFPVHGFIGACENMPSGTAQRPGDIVRAKNGKTVEILNTDAEGRLVLGDVLAWATEFQPSAIVDLATLTGAISVALGPYMTGLFSNNDALSEELLGAARDGGEEMWRMPLAENLKDLIKSPVADLKNTGGPKGGSITAALFLRDFVADVPWAHLDIAGPAFLDKEKGVDSRGGTGHGVRTLVELVRRRMQKE